MSDEQTMNSEELKAQLDESLANADNWMRNCEAVAKREREAISRIAALEAALNSLYVVREKCRGGISYNRLADELDRQLEELGPTAALDAMLERAVRETVKEAARLIEIDSEIMAGTSRGIWLDRAARYVEENADIAAIVQRVKDGA